MQKCAFAENPHEACMAGQESEKETGMGPGRGLTEFGGSEYSGTMPATPLVKNDSPVSRATASTKTSPPRRSPICCSSCCIHTPAREWPTRYTLCRSLLLITCGKRKHQRSCSQDAHHVRRAQRQHPARALMQLCAGFTLCEASSETELLMTCSQHQHRHRSAHDAHHVGQA